MGRTSWIALAAACAAFLYLMAAGPMEMGREVFTDKGKEGWAKAPAEMTEIAGQETGVAGLAEIGGREAELGRQEAEIDARENLPDAVGVSPDSAGDPAQRAPRGGDRPPAEAADQKEYRLVAIGDSLTKGVGDKSNGGGYVGYLQEQLASLTGASSKVRIENFGKPGHRSDQLLQRLESGELAEALRDAEWIAMSIGGNDLLKVMKDNILHLTYEPFADERDRFGRRLQAIMERLRTYNPDAPIYVLGLFNPFQDWFQDVPEMTKILQEWNDVVLEATESCEGAVFVPIADLFAEQGARLLSDDLLHPNENGYALIGERVLLHMPAAGKEAAE